MVDFKFVFKILKQCSRHIYLYLLKKGVSFTFFLLLSCMHLRFWKFLIYPLDNKCTNDMHNILMFHFLKLKLFYVFIINPEFSIHFVVLNSKIMLFTTTHFETTSHEKEILITNITLINIILTNVG